MGITNSRSLDHGGEPQAAHLLHAVKRGEHLKALRLLTLMPESTRAIPPAAKATAVHSAVKRGYVSILQFLRDLPSNASSNSAIAAVRAASHAATHSTVPSSGNGTTTSSRRASRFSQQSDPHQNHPRAEEASRQSGLERDSWINAVDRHGRTPLMTAVRYNRLELVEGLVSLGADPWVCDRSTRGTALHHAALLGQVPMVAAILMSQVTGLDHRVALFNFQDMYGFTPLHYAAAAGHADVARVLLDAGASYTAASQLLYDPTPGLRRLTSLTSIAGRAGCSFGLGRDNDEGDDRGGVLPAPCAPRSNPLHLAAMRGDAAVATLVLQRFLADTDGLSRAARERVTDPRTQLNKDGFQPYMLAGNAGHWHVAQLLIPHSRDDRHHLSRNRDRDFLNFFPLPEPGSNAGNGEGPPSLAELAARVWAAKLVADVRSAEATVRQLQQNGQWYSCATASPVSFGGGSGSGSAAAAAVLLKDATRTGGGVLGALLRRSGRCAATSSSGNGATAATAVVAGSSSCGGSSSRRGGLIRTASFTLETAATTAATAAAASPSVAVAGENAPARPSCTLAEVSRGPSGASTPRTSVSGNSPGGCITGVGSGDGECHAAPSPKRCLFLAAPSSLESHRTTSLDLTPCSPGLSLAATGAGVAAVVSPLPQPTSPSPPPRGATYPRMQLISPAWPLKPLQQPSAAADATAGSPAAAVVITAPGSPVTPALAALSLLPPPPPPPLCDVCFEQVQELALRPCPHRMCATCCRRVVEMHCSGLGPATAAAAAAARASGRKPAVVPPRCPFCQATIRGFVPAAAMAAPAALLRQ